MNSINNSLEYLPMVVYTRGWESSCLCLSLWLLRSFSYCCHMFHVSEKGFLVNFRTSADLWWIWFLISEQLLDKADHFPAPATLNLIPLNGKQGTLQSVADTCGGRSISARGRKSRNKEEEVCLLHVRHFAHHKNSTILTLTVPTFPAWFHLCNKIKRLYRFLGNNLLLMSIGCV